MMIGKNKAALSLILGALFFWLMPAVVEAACTVSIGTVSYPSVQSAVNGAGVGRTIKVDGTCNENVVFAENRLNLVLDGQTTATLSGPSTSQATISVRGSGIVIKRFLSITGGENGIQVLRGGTARIANNIIQGVGNNGVVINRNGSADVINNAIQNNPDGSGIVVNDQGQAFIGILSRDDVTASANVIGNNGNYGIVVEGSSDAVIVGNTIANNGKDGILVHQVSHADIADNTINGNLRHGINVGRNSGVDLGTSSPLPVASPRLVDQPNHTTTNNTSNGIRCFMNSYVDGLLNLNPNATATTNPLTGTAGQINISSNCANDLDL